MILFADAAEARRYVWGVATLIGGWTAALLGMLFPSLWPLILPGLMAFAIGILLVELQAWAIATRMAPGGGGKVVTRRLALMFVVVPWRLHTVSAFLRARDLVRRGT